MSNLSPVVLFVYNRLWHSRRTVKSLQKNSLARESDLIIYSDGSENETAEQAVGEVREFIKTVDGFRSVKIIEQDQNLGLAESIISGVTEVINKCGRVIVLEDDLITSPYFLDYMNEALEFYKDDMRIFSVTGLNYLRKISSRYEYDVYLSYRSSSWGWGTWKNRWERVDWEVDNFDEFKKNKKAQKLFNRGGQDLTKTLFAQMNNKIDSWSIRWLYAHHKNNAFCVYPVHNMVKNIGFDNSGVHCGKNEHYRYTTEIEDNAGKIELTKNIEVSETVLKAFRSFFKRSIRGKIRKLLQEVFC